MKKPLAVILAIGIAATVAVTGIIISNVLRYQGALEQNALEVSDTGGITGPVTLLNGTAAIFNLTVANLLHQSVNYTLNFSFTTTLTLSSISADLVRIFLDNGSYTNSTEVLAWRGTYFADSRNYTLAPFEATWFELRLTATYTGSGTYTLDVDARES